MRVLFTSLFFCLVAIFTLASHPPLEAIAHAFGRDNPIQSDPKIADTSPAPTGIIPISEQAEPLADTSQEPATIPEPIAVPEPKIAATPKEEPKRKATSTNKLETEIAIAAAPEAITPPEAEENAKEPPSAPSENRDTPENRSFVRALNLHAVYFGTGKTHLPPSSRPGIDAATTRLANLPEGLSIIIGGHTDAHSEAANASEIGNLRARAVLDALITAGAPSDRLQLAHYPTASKRPNPSEAWRDRRVEFHLLPPR